MPISPFRLRAKPYQGRFIGSHWQHATSAKVVIPLSGLHLAAEETATLTVFHGPEDCLTFDHDLGYREVKTRFWPQHSKPVSAIDGQNTIELTDLVPGATIHFRILIESNHGRIWSFETDHFSTLQ